MPEVRVNVTQAQVAFVEESLRSVPGAVKPAIRSAINDTLKHVRTQMVRGVRDVLNAPAGEVRDRITVTSQPTAEKLEGTIGIRYKPIEMTAFKAKYSKKGGGVRVTIVKQQGQQTFRNFFVNKLPVSSKVAVLGRRKGAPKVKPSKGTYEGRVIKRGPNKGQPLLRQPVDKKFGASVYKAVEVRPEFLDESQRDAAEYLDKRIVSKIDYQLSTKAKK